MCYFLQKVRRVEVLKMQAEFFRDDNDNVWFSNCKNINVRRVVPTRPTSQRDEDEIP